MQISVSIFGVYGNTVTNEININMEQNFECKQKVWKRDFQEIEAALIKKLRFQRT